MSLKISRILHAGYFFECDQTKIIFDPIFENPFSRNCYAFPSVTFDHQQIQNLAVDAVFISHYHDDHCSLESLKYLSRKTPIYMFCLYEEIFHMIKELGFENVYSIQLNKPLKMGSFTITPRRALDADVDSIFHIEAKGLNILNVVDSWIDLDTFEKLLETPKWDLILWPFQTLREIEVLAPTRVQHAPPEIPVEWLDQIQKLNPRALVPSSCQFQFEEWSWYNSYFFPISYKFFKSEIQKILPDCQIMQLDPSCALTLLHSLIERAKGLSWVHLADSKQNDFVYNPHCQPMPTAEIAKKFTALTPIQIDHVNSFCKSTLIEKFNSLPPSKDPYFQSRRHWRLTVYDHQGQAQHFYYSIDRGQMSAVTNEVKPQWSTEVPQARLYGAIANGESLTSMYIRINNIEFDQKIETEINSLDILEDPLIRCLYSAEFGTYQKAQLQNIFSVKKN